MNSLKPKVCYVLPQYDPATDTHLNHLYEFLEHVGSRLDIFLVVEEAQAPVAIKNITRWYVQRFRFFLLRAVENFVLVFLLRLRGWRTFYIHYSFLSAFNASLVVRLLGGRTLYWNCGLPWLYTRNFVRDFFERLTYRFITHLVTGTDSLADAYARHYHIPREKVRVMPNWIDLQEVKSQKLENGTFYSGSPEPKARGRWSKVKSYEVRERLDIQPDERVVLFVHRLSRRKGAQLLPEIIRELDDAGVVFLIVGEGPERADVELRITQYALRNRVRFLGGVPNREVFQYFAIADAFLMPSEEEGFPRVLLEAMAAGVPFVSSAMGGVREIVPEAAHPYLVTEPTPELFAKKIRAVLTLPAAEEARLKESLQAWVRRYDLPAVAENFFNLMVDISRHTHA